MEQNLLDIEKMFLIKKVYDKYLSRLGNDGKLSAGFVVFAETLLAHKFTSQQELSDYIGCNKAHTSRMILKMQLKGLVKQNSFELTAKGKKFAEEAITQKKNLIKELFKDSSSQDVSVFVKVLSQVLENAEKIQEES